MRNPIRRKTPEEREAKALNRLSKVLFKRNMSTEAMAWPEKRSIYVHYSNPEHLKNLRDEILKTEGVSEREAHRLVLAYIDQIAEAKDMGGVQKLRRRKRPNLIVSRRKGEERVALER